MKRTITVVLTAFVAVFLWMALASAQGIRKPLVFSKFAPEIAREFGEIKPENVLIVVVTEAPGNMAYIVVIMKSTHTFKWARGPYETALERLRAVIEKKSSQKPLSGKFNL